MLAHVWYEAVFVRNAANVARKNSLVPMSWAGQGRSYLNSLGSSELRKRERERDRERERQREREGRKIERQRERGERVGLHLDDTQA